MTTSEREAISTDRIRLPFAFDVEGLCADIDALGLKDYVYYDVLALRSPAHLVDPSLPVPPPAADYADGSWTEWLNTEALESSSHLMAVVKTFQEQCDVTLVRLIRLAAGSVVEEHTDPTLNIDEKKSVIRLTVPVTTNDGVTFYLNNRPVLMQPGECWYMRLSDPHSVVNDGPTERINLTIDVRPNDWVRSLLVA